MLIPYAGSEKRAVTRKYNDRNRNAEIERLYLTGMSYEAIAEVIGWPTESVSRKCREMNLPPRLAGTRRAAR